MSKPIDEKFLDRRDFFGLKFRDGYVFFEIEDWELIQYKPYTQLSTVTSRSNLGSTRLEDSAGDDILHMSGNKEKIIHGSIGIDPAMMRMYTKYPEDSGTKGTWPNLTSPSSNNGNDYGYVNGQDSPFEQPTQDAELFIPPEVHLSFDFYNTDNNDDRQPVLNLRFREYDVNILNPDNSRDKRVITDRIMTPGSPVPIAPAGAISSKMSFNLEREWGVQAITRKQIDRIRQNIRGNGGSR
jgi:hypothetical protein